MCLAVPMRLNEVRDDGNGVAELEGVTYPVNLSFIEQPQVGDYVIVHAGFEPLDILFALKEILTQLVTREARIVNHYARVVRQEGNPKILALFERYLQPIDARWRGLGIIPGSGLGLKPEYSQWNAECRWGVSTAGGKNHPGCRCGEVLEGAIAPPECGLFGRACTPRKPIGPCMVSAEGTCAAYFKYVRRAV